MPLEVKCPDCKSIVSYLSDLVSSPLTETKTLVYACEKCGLAFEINAEVWKNQSPLQPTIVNPFTLYPTTITTTAIGNTTQINILGVTPTTSNTIPIDSTAENPIYLKAGDTLAVTWKFAW